MSEFSDRVLDAVGPAFRDRAGEVLDPLVDGLTSEVAATDEMFAPAGARGWAALFDLNATAFPAWLGQIAGTKVPGGLSLEEQRDFIRNRRASRRGTAGAIKAAVAGLLTGTRSVELVERNGSPWRLTVRAYNADLPPGVTVDDLRAAASTQKPVGIVIDAQVMSGADYAHMAGAHGPTYADFTTAFATYDQARDHIPEA